MLVSRRDNRVRREKRLYYWASLERAQRCSSISPSGQPRPFCLASFTLNRFSFITQRLLHRYPVKIFFVTMMHADGHRWMIKTDTGKIVSLIVIDRQWRKRSAPVGNRELYCARRAGCWPAGILYQPDGQRILHHGLSAFIRVHPLKKMLYNKWTNQFITMMHADGRRWMIKTDTGKIVPSLW